MSAVGLAAVTIIAVSFVAAPTLFGGALPFWEGATSSTTAATSTTGGALSVQINIAKDPTTLGSVQTVTVTVLDQSGQPVPAVTVRLESTSPSGQTSVSERSTDSKGVCTIVWQIAASPSNVGTYLVKVSATKAGYETGRAQGTFQVTKAH